MTKKLSKKEINDYLKSCNKSQIQKFNAFVTMWQIIFYFIMLCIILGLMVAVKYLFIWLVY